MLLRVVLTYAGKILEGNAEGSKDCDRIRRTSHSARDLRNVNYRFARGVGIGITIRGIELTKHVERPSCSAFSHRASKSNISPIITARMKVSKRRHKALRHHLQPQPPSSH